MKKSKACVFLATAILLWILHGLNAGACTTVIVSSGASSTGRPLLWKQRDTDKPFNVLRYVKGEKFSYTAVFNAEDKECKSAFGGANEAGFAIMNNASYNLSRSEYDAKNGVVITKALATCSTVEDFELLLKTWPSPRKIESNFGVADAYGSAAYFEVGDEDITRFDVEEGAYLLRTNFSLSGREREGSGMVRYETASYLLSRHKGKFSPEALIDGLGRSFYNFRLEKDMSKRSGAIALDVDFIPRFTTVSSICIEGVKQGEPLNSTVLWTAIGYTPCCYAVPVWVAAGNEIPSFLSPSEQDGMASANVLANSLMAKAHPVDRDGKGKYIDLSLVKPIMKIVRKFEKQEFKAGKEIDFHMRREFNKETVVLYNQEAQSRFDLFFEIMTKKYGEK